MSTQPPTLAAGVADIIARHGFEPFHTGGNCWAFYRHGDTADDAYMVSAEGCVEEEADAPAWQGWRERWDVDPETGPYASNYPTAAGLTLDDAIVAVLKLALPGTEKDAP